MKYLLILLLVVANLSVFANDKQSSSSCVKELAQLKEFFPTPLNYDDENNGLVSTDVAISPESLIEAYTKGLFPWEDLGDTMAWFSPPNRGVLIIEEALQSRKIRRDIRKAQELYTVTIDKDFAGVINSCATVARNNTESNSSDTWISDKIINNYIELHNMGIAHSVEVWDGDELIGGIYGVFIDGVFAGESMFNKADNASKLALGTLIEYLNERGATMMDAQMVTGITGRFGAKFVPREEFLKLKEAESKKGVTFK